MKKIISLFSIAALAWISGCSGPAEEESGLTKITLQTDWYAQAEHGGFYQALAEGYYEEVGLDVEILQGGPNAIVTQKIATRNADFGIGRADDIVLHASRGLPIIMVGALMQHDPQALLFHEESGIKGFKDLDGKTIMTTPGSVFIEVLEEQFDITLNVTPLDYGMSRFLADKNFIQQCFITNEPYYVTREGANAKTLLLADAGFDPYRVIYTNSGFAQKNPEVVKAFVAASTRGWESYMAGPREAANAIIAERNPKMTDEFLNYSLSAMAEHKLISGSGPRQAVGLIVPERVQQTVDHLYKAGMIENKIAPEVVAPSEYLPPHLQEMLAASE